MMFVCIKNGHYYLIIAIRHIIQELRQIIVPEIDEYANKINIQLNN